MKLLSKPFALMFVGTVCFAAAAAAYTPPEVKQVGDVVYITGGIGEGEAEALKHQDPKYNLYVSSADTDGAFVDGTQLTITDAKGAVVLDVLAGPLLDAHLAPGKYTVVASANGQTSKRKFTIGSKPATLHFGWRPDGDDNVGQ